MNCYTYLIGWSSINMFYYGAKYSKNASPDKFWVYYFSSSKYVKQYREKYGEPDIIEIRKTFGNDISKCYNWETKVLRRLKVKNNNKFINISENTKDTTLKNANKANILKVMLGTHNFINNHPMKSYENKCKISESNKRRSELGLLNCQINNPMKNKDISEKSRQHQLELVKNGEHWSQKQDYRDKMSIIMKSKNMVVSDKVKKDNRDRLIKNNPMSSQHNKDKMSATFVKKIVSTMSEHSLSYSNKNEWNESINYLKSNNIIKITRSYENYLKYKELL